jgi:hypothetical protein
MTLIIAACMPDDCVSFGCVANDGTICVCDRLSICWHGISCSATFLIQICMPLREAAFQRQRKCFRSPSGCTCEIQQFDLTITECKAESRDIQGRCGCANKEQPVSDWPRSFQDSTAQPVVINSGTYMYQSNRRRCAALFVHLPTI